MRRDGSCDVANAPSGTCSPALRDVIQEFEELRQGYETGLLLSMHSSTMQELDSDKQEHVRREASRLASADLRASRSRKRIRRALEAAESLGKSAEEQLHRSDGYHGDAPDSDLKHIPHGHFRLYSTELFELLGEPTDLRFGTLRFSTRVVDHPSCTQRPGVEVTTSLELALNTSFFVADSHATEAYHSFSIPEAPSLTNRGILCRKPDDGGAFPEYDSWILFTFLADGCLKIEIPIEMCADVYGGNLRGRENEEVVFWGLFVEDEP